MEYIGLIKLLETFFDGGEQVTVDLETYNSLGTIFRAKASLRDFDAFLASRQLKREFIVVKPGERFTALVAEYGGLCFAGPKAVLMLHLEKELALTCEGEHPVDDCTNALNVLGIVDNQAPVFNPSFTTFKSSREEFVVRLTKCASKEGDRYSLLGPGGGSSFVDRKHYISNYYQRRRDDSGTWKRKHSHSVSGKHFFFDFQQAGGMEWRQSSEFPRKLFV